MSEANDPFDHFPEQEEVQSWGEFLKALGVTADDIAKYGIVGALRKADDE